MIGDISLLQKKKFKINYTTKNFNGKLKVLATQCDLYLKKKKLTAHTFRTYRQRSMKRCSCKWNIERQTIVNFCPQHLSDEKQVQYRGGGIFFPFFPLNIEQVQLPGAT